MITIDNVGVYCELILGIQQVFMMIDLNLMLRFTALDPTEELLDVQAKQEKYMHYININKYYAFLMIAIAVIACLICNYEELTSNEDVH